MLAQGRGVENLEMPARGKWPTRTSESATESAGPVRPRCYGVRYCKEGLTVAFGSSTCQERRQITPETSPQRRRLTLPVNPYSDDLHLMETFAQLGLGPKETRGKGKGKGKGMGSR